MSISSVSTNTLSSGLQQTVARLQSQLNTVSTESSSGTLADIGLTLGAQSGQDIALHQQLDELNAISGSNANVTAQLTTASNALTSLQSSASSMLQQFITGQSSPPGSTGAVGIAQAAASALQSFGVTANTETGGAYVFGGVNTGVAPIAAYAQTPPGAAQLAVDSAFQTAFGMSPTDPNVSTISASAMTSFLDTQFHDLFSGSNWTSNWSSASSTPQTSRIAANETVTSSVSANQPAFQQMAEALTMVSEFGGANLNSSAYSALLTKAQSVMNQANTGLIETTAAVGVMQNRLTAATSSIGLQVNVLTTQIGANENVNSYDVTSQVTNLTNQLQVAYSLTAQIHKLSLVNFL